MIRKYITKNFDFMQEDTVSDLEDLCTRFSPDQLVEFMKHICFFNTFNNPEDKYFCTKNFKELEYSGDSGIFNWTKNLTEAKYSAGKSNNCVILKKPDNHEQYKQLRYSKLKGGSYVLEYRTGGKSEIVDDFGPTTVPEVYHVFIKDFDLTEAVKKFKFFKEFGVF